MEKALVLTISDSGFRGQREDLSGPEARKILESLNFDVLRVDVLPDEQDQIAQRLRRAADEEDIRLVVTTGGTGFSSRDVTPEATLAVADRQAPGLAELMRSEGMKKTPRAALSRAVVVIRKSTLIINLPGSVRGVSESLGAVAPLLGHAVEVLAQGSMNCGEGE